MNKLTNVRSSIRPSLVDESSSKFVTYVRSNIKEHNSVDDGDIEYTYYTFDEIHYSKEEYMLINNDRINKEQDMDIMMNTETSLDLFEIVLPLSIMMNSLLEEGTLPVNSRVSSLMDIREGKNMDSIVDAYVMSIRYGNRKLEDIPDNLIDKVSRKIL